MAEQTHTSLTLEQLSTQAGMGKYHFSHMFRKWYGISPMQYYISKKMERACSLLVEGTLSIDEIAERLGYLETGYFRKAFKNYFGITPSTYRRYIVRKEQESAKMKETQRDRRDIFSGDGERDSGDR